MADEIREEELNDEEVTEETANNGENSEENEEEVAPQTVDAEGLLKEVQQLRKEYQYAIDRAEMLQEKLDNLQVNGKGSEEDEEDLITRKEAAELAKQKAQELLMEERISQVYKKLSSSEYNEDFEKYLAPLITKRKSLAARIIEADDPVAEALDVLSVDPNYRAAKEKETNTKTSKKIVENLNKPKNLSAASGSSVGKKSPKEMSVEEFLAEQNKVLEGE